MTHVSRDDECCDTLSRMPIPTKLMTSDDPPLLTKGSGMPFVGIRPSTTLTLMNACTATIVVRPSARNGPNVAGARRRTRDKNPPDRAGRANRHAQPAPRHEKKTEDPRGRPRQTELLSDDGINEI